MLNRVSAVLSDADRDLVIAAINTIRDKLPFRFPLTPAQRQTEVKMGPQSEQFVRQALDIAEANPAIFPGTFSVAELRKDLNLYEVMSALMTLYSQLFEEIEDTIFALRAELIDAALEVYKFVKLAADEGVAGMDSHAETLGEQFASSGSPSTPTVPVPNP